MEGKFTIISGNKKIIANQGEFPIDGFEITLRGDNEHTGAVNRPDTNTIENFRLPFGAEKEVLYTVFNSGKPPSLEDRKIIIRREG